MVDGGIVTVFFFKQKTAYEMRISDWSSDVCSSDLAGDVRRRAVHRLEQRGELPRRVEVRRRRDADGAGDRRAEIGEDVAEEIGGHHHVEPVREIGRAHV